jgi:hypothetical protein
MRKENAPNRPTKRSSAPLLFSFLCVTSLASTFLAITHIGRLRGLLLEEGTHRDLSSILPHDSSNKNDDEPMKHCLGLGEYFDERIYAKAVDGLVQFHQKGGNLKSVQKFMDGSIDYTLDNLDLQFIPKERRDQADDGDVPKKATEYLKTYYEQHPSPRQGYGEPLPGVWSNQKHKALFNERLIDVMERREGWEKWDAGLGPMGPPCRHEIMLGDRKGDGYKFMCVLQPPPPTPLKAPTASQPHLNRTGTIQKNETQRSIKSNSTCHVISVGGNDNWKFERLIAHCRAACRSANQTTTASTFSIIASTDTSMSTSTVGTLSRTINC